MKPLRIFRQDHLDILKSRIRTNVARYQQESPWIDEVFEGATWHQEAAVRATDIELRMPDKDNLYDVENTEAVYTALETLTPAQAADERLWTALSHSYFWEYMTKRWPVSDKKNKEEFIRTRYFFMTDRSRALVRNGIARLWWYGHFTYEPDRADPFELTRVLLSKLDIAQSILERNVSNVPGLARAVLDSLHERKEMARPFDDRHEFRSLMRHLNAMGGVTILDTVDRSEFQDIVGRKIESIELSRGDSQ